MSVTDISTELAADMVTRNIFDYGDQALMLECDSTAHVLAWTQTLRAAALPGVVDIVGASRTVLVKLAGPRFQGVTRQRIRRLPVDPDLLASEHQANRCRRRSSTSSTTAPILPRSPAIPV